MAISDFMQVKVHACVGGTAVRDDIRTLQSGVQVVVGTPGRVFDMINRRALRLGKFRFLSDRPEYTRSPRPAQPRLPMPPDASPPTPLASTPDHMRIFALDEADEMLSRGFKDQIYDVFKFLPENVQCCLFSATMPLDILEITTRFMRGTLCAVMERRRSFVPCAASRRSKLVTTTHLSYSTPAPPLASHRISRLSSQPLAHLDFPPPPHTS